MAAFFKTRAGRSLTGVIFVVLVLGGSVVGVAKGFGAFSRATTITAVLPTAGPALATGAEVEFRGVLVGSLSTVTREPHRAVLTIHLNPAQVDNVPAGSTVRLVPRSVFGDLYVDLVPPAQPAGHVQAGAVLKADTSTATVQLDQALDAGYRLLSAVRPAKIAATLTAVATALHGRGAELGNLVEQVESYLKRATPHTGELVHDITQVGTVGRELSASAPDLLSTLDDAIATSRTIVASQAQLRKVLTAGPGVADQTNALLRDNRTRLNTLVHLLAPVIGVLDSHRSNLVHTVKVLEHFLPRGARALAQGPFLKVTVSADLKGKDGRRYTAANCPRYPGMSGPNCAHAQAATTHANGAGMRALIKALTDAGRHDPTAATEQQRLSITRILIAPLLSSLGELRLLDGLVAP